MTRNIDEKFKPWGKGIEEGADENANGKVDAEALDRESPRESTCNRAGGIYVHPPTLSCFITPNERLLNR